MRRTRGPIVLAAAAYILAGGFVHLREWLDLYRHLPASVPGSAVVRLGFPINVALSVMAAGALLFTARASISRAWLAVIGSALFQVGSLAAVIRSRMGSLFGWSELGWTRAAKQSLVVEIAALAMLVALGVIIQLERRHRVDHRQARSTSTPISAISATA